MQEDHFTFSIKVLINGSNFLITLVKALVVGNAVTWDNRKKIQEKNSKVALIGHSKEIQVVSAMPKVNSIVQRLGIFIKWLSCYFLFVK